VPRHRPRHAANWLCFVQPVPSEARPTLSGPARFLIGAGIGFVSSRPEHALFIITPFLPSTCPSHCQPTIGFVWRTYVRGTVLDGFSAPCPFRPARWKLGSFGTTGPPRGTGRLGACHLPSAQKLGLFYRRSARARLIATPFSKSTYLSCCDGANWLRFARFLPAARVRVTPPTLDLSLLAPEELASFGAIGTPREPFAIRLWDSHAPVRARSATQGTGA
jgi:hypothetical protein